MKIRYWLAAALVGGLWLALSAYPADRVLLNVSYDPTRAFRTPTPAE
jgi:hypothetical protein